jgi:hypothetical protein
MSSLTAPARLGDMRAAATGAEMSESLVRPGVRVS